MKSNNISQKIKTMNTHFVKHAFYYLGVVGAIILTAIILVSVIGFKLGFDFKGGTIVEVVYGIETNDVGDPYPGGAPYNESLTKEKIKNVISENFEISSIQIAESEYGNKVVFKLTSNEKLTTAQETELKENLYNEFSEYNPTGILQSKYITVSSVEGTKSDVAKYASIALATAIVILALGTMIRYGLSSGITILLTSIINVLLCMSIVLICRITIDVQFVGSVLTVFMLSLISNLVFFDKLRDVRKNAKTSILTRKEQSNLATKNTLIPSAIILGISLICSILLTGFGTLSIRTFGIPVLIGTIFVSLSTIYLCPMLYNYIKTNKSGK